MTTKRKRRTRSWKHGGGPRLPSILDRRLTRRNFIAAGAGAAAVLALGNTRCDPAITRRVHQASVRGLRQDAVWIWQFSIDGPAREIIDVLARYGLAAVIKTHDGTQWMSKYDDVPGAVDGPRTFETLAAIFADGGVPLHAWAVVTGVDPEREADMASQILDAGARSLTLDLEYHESFWQGTKYDAVRFGQMLRARHDLARIDVSIDPRPWKMLEIPLAEFAEFCDGIRPQMDWDLFDDPDHVNAYTYFGHPPPAGAITPEFLVDTTYAFLAPFDRWIVPIGPGAPLEPWAFHRFIERCEELRIPQIDMWRSGPSTRDALTALSSHEHWS